MLLKTFSISVYGVSRALEDDKTVVKTLWAVLTFVSCVFGLYMICKNITEFYDYDVVRKTKTIDLNIDTFPAVAFCPYVYSNDIIEIGEVALDGNAIDINFEKSDELSGCYRYNSYRTVNTSFVNSSSVGIYRNLRFLINVIEPLNIFITDNYLNSFEKTVQFLGDSKSIYISLYRTVQTKLGTPFSGCHKMNATYRHLNCKQECIYQNVADKYNCSFIGFRFFTRNTLRENRCDLNAVNMTERHSLRQFTHKMMSEFGVRCEESCAVECTTIRYNNILMTMDKSNISYRLERNSSFKVVYVYFEQFSYTDIS